MKTCIDAGVTPNEATGKKLNPDQADAPESRANFTKRPSEFPIQLSQAPTNPNEFLQIYHGNHQNKNLIFQSNCSID